MQKIQSRADRVVLRAAAVLPSIISVHDCGLWWLFASIVLWSA